jgi:hypothetical protein
MSIRLYDTAWIELEGQATPVQVRRDVQRHDVFRVGDQGYDIDGRPDVSTLEAPRIVRVLSLQTVRESGLTLMAHQVPVAHIAVRSVRSAARGTNQKLLEIA